MNFCCTGQVGGMDILGEVAEYLKYPHLEKAARMALCKSNPLPQPFDSQLTHLIPAAHVLKSRLQLQSISAFQHVSLDKQLFVSSP